MESRLQVGASCVRCGCVHFGKELFSKEIYLGIFAHVHVPGLRLVAPALDLPDVCALDVGPWYSQAISSSPPPVNTNFHEYCGVWKTHKEPSRYD